MNHGTEMQLSVSNGPVTSYILIAISEILASITGLEYAFTKAPKNMRSLVMAVFLFMTAFSSAIGEAFVCAYFCSYSLGRTCLIRLFPPALSADPLLVWNYGVMAVLAFITGVIFWFAVRKLDAKEDLLNNLSAGHVTVEDEKHHASEKA